MKRACIIHDQVNLVLLPLLGGLTIAGLTGHVAPELVTHLFLAYVLLDMGWVFLIPEAVPSLPGVILLHHGVTAALLLIPLRYPHLHTYTCIDGLVELNTFFLIARRQWRSLRKFFSLAYWCSFLPMRLVVYPVLVPVFLSEMRAAKATWWETLVCVGSQVILTAFNILLLSLSVINWNKRRGEAKAKQEAAAGGPAGAAARKQAGASAAGSSGVRTRRRAARAVSSGSEADDEAGESFDAIKAAPPAVASAAVRLRARAQ